MFFRNRSLSDRVEHEIKVNDGAEPGRLVPHMTIFDRSTVAPI
jgi:hypothetical protein